MRFNRTWETPPLSTDSKTAARWYWDGIFSLVVGIPDADALLSEAVAFDPNFYLARIGIAATRALADEEYRHPATTKAILRGERQHAEIVKSVFTNQHRRAHDLRREHLLEYPGDFLIVWLPAVRQLR